jgi:hypothetical protein
MANIPGASNITPGVVVDNVTQSKGTAAGLGNRLPVIIGEGQSKETIIASANGQGKDGLGPDFKTVNGANGRYYRTKVYPLVENRTELYRNGVALKILEQRIDNLPFSFKYDARVDPNTGKIELQTAQLVDQGGSFYAASSTNKGDGTISGLALLDVNAVAQRWTIRCSDVQRAAGGVIIPGTAKFIAVGAKTGPKLDKNGNPIVWVSNGVKKSNGVLEFAISERSSGGVVANPFQPGDSFVVDVTSGVLDRGDSLTARYIPLANINAPITLSSLDDVTKMFGEPSLENTLSLGAQLAFANAAPAIMCLQAAPALPRRTSVVLTEQFVNDLTNDDNFLFPLDQGVTVDTDSSIHFFITNPATLEETQVLPNKIDYNTIPKTGASPVTVHDFVTDNNGVDQGGYGYCYSTTRQMAVLYSGFDGALTRTAWNSATLKSALVFDSSYVGKKVKIINSAYAANQGTFDITAVSGGMISFSATSFSDFANETAVAFEVLLNSSLTPVTSGTGLDGVITASVGTGTSDLTSATVDFSLISNIANGTYSLRVNSAVNGGIFDITGFDNMTGKLTIRKAFVSEPNLATSTTSRFEVLDPNTTSEYVMVNHQIVPDGWRLRITMVDSRDAAFFDGGWLNALEALEKVEVDIVVPLPRQTISVIFQNTMAHCLSMSSLRNRRERVLFIGAINGLKPENLVENAQLVAVEDIGVLEGIQGDSPTEILNGSVEDISNYSVPDAYGSTYRCMYMYPDQIVVVANGESLLIDGYFAACAAAGWCAREGRIETAMTNQVLAGFTILNDKLLAQSVIEQLCAAGVCVLQPVAGGGNCIWSITTTQSGLAEEQEMSIVFIRDRISKLLRLGCKSFIGQTEQRDGGTQIALNVRCVTLLDAYVTQNLITQYADLTVVRDAAEPRQWDVSVRVQPPYPVNWIYIRLQTGFIS